MSYSIRMTRENFERKRSVNKPEISGPQVLGAGLRLRTWFFLRASS
jgi:hypothetical protein